MPPPSSQLFWNFQPTCSPAFLVSTPDSPLQGPSSKGAGTPSGASCTVHALPVRWESQNFSRAGAQHVDVSTAAARPQPRPPPSRDVASESCQSKDTEPGSVSGPGSIYDFLSQGWRPGTSHSGTLPAPSASRRARARAHTHVLIWKREQWIRSTSSFLWPPCALPFGSPILR